MPASTLTDGSIDRLCDLESVPIIPAAGKSIYWVDSIVKRLLQMQDSGAVQGLLSRNWSVTSQSAGGFAVDTYVTNSGLLIPSCGLQVGQAFRWRIALSKTAAGTATPIVQIRLGAAQSTGDTSLITLTGQAATAAVSGGYLDVSALVQSVGAAGVLACAFGFATGIPGFGGGIDGASAGFNTAGKAGQYMGVSYNGGASAVITVTSVMAELFA